MRRLRSSKGPDLCERTFQFGVRITKMVRRLPRDVAGHEIGRQVLRSGTSVGANMEEADAAESTEDFFAQNENRIEGSAGIAILVEKYS